MTENSNKAEETSATASYSNHQLGVAGDFVSMLMDRPWFGDLFDQNIQPELAKLAFKIVLCYRDGFLPTKSQAMRFMKAGDARTSQRYLELLERKGLLKVEQSTLDKRISLLCPTDALLTLVEKQFSAVADWLRIYTHELVLAGLPNTGAPALATFTLGSRLYYAETPMARARRLMAQETKWDHAEIGRDWNAYQISQYTQTIKLAPKNANALSGRGYVYLLENEFDNAISDFDAALALRPDGRDFFLRGFANSRIGQTTRALSDLSQALVLIPSDGYGYLIRAQLLVHEGEFEKAITDFTKAIEFSAPLEHRFDLPNVYAQRGHAYKRLGERELAIRDYEQALRGLESLAGTGDVPNEDELTVEVNEALKELRSITKQGNALDRRSSTD